MEPMEISSSSGPGQTILKGRPDRYDGFIIDPAGLPSDPTAFHESLRCSLSHWKSQKKKGIWLKLPTRNADLIKVALDEGFSYHHAEKDYLMLTNWIDESPSTIPSNASHQVGVGAVVIHDDKILAVKERTGPTRDADVWKMPTGVVGQGEDIKDAVVREVKEETGVDAEFIEILGVRQVHEAAFGKSDLFFLCLLRPMHSAIVADDTEIAAAQWMSLEAYRSQEFNIKSGLLTRIADITDATLNGDYKGFGAEILTFGFRNKGSYFYHNTKDIEAWLGERMGERIKEAG